MLNLCKKFNQQNKRLLNPTRKRFRVENFSNISLF